MRFHHVGWPLHGVAGERTNYSIRLLRYWFARSLLERLHKRLGRPIHVLEVGVGGGAELRRFIGAKPWIGRWDGLDVNRPQTGAEFYDDFIAADVELPFALPRTYDVVLLSHILEHLAEPEAVMARLLGELAPEGVLIGGSPTMPHTLGRLRERFLRRKNEKVPVHEHRHLSVITPTRIRRFAQASKLEIELLTGTFFLRWTGFVFENFPAWIRLNLAWGALAPSLGGELYFSLRKPAQRDRRS